MIKSKKLPAFPLQEVCTVAISKGERELLYGFAGLSKREYYASAAMNGYLSFGGNSGVIAERAAEYGVMAADALIAELAKGGAT